MSAVSYQMKYLTKPPFTSEQALFMRVFCGSQPKFSSFSDSLSHRSESFTFVVTWPAWRFDYWTYAAAPSTHHVCNMRHSSVRSAQAKTKITSTFFVRKTGKEINRLKIAPHLVCDEVKDCCGIGGHDSPVPDELCPAQRAVGFIR